MSTKNKKAPSRLTKSVKNFSAFKINLSRNNQLDMNCPANHYNGAGHYGLSVVRETTRSAES